MEIRIPKLNTKNAVNFMQELGKIEMSSVDELNFIIESDFAEPLGMLLCGTGIKEIAKKYPTLKKHISICDNACTDYMAYMGFFKYISYCINYGNSPGAVTSTQRYVAITPIDFNELQKNEICNCNFIEMNETVEKKAKELAKVLCGSDCNLTKLFTYIIREILRNIPEHSSSTNAVICAQCWSNGNAEIAVLDKGIGIRQSLNKNNVHKEYTGSNADALKYAIEPGISQSFDPAMKNKGDEWANSGFGLYMASQICSTLKGKFSIISDTDALIIQSNSHEVIKTKFAGTAIGMSFNTNALVEDSQRLINKIAKKGEEKAKAIRNAFKHASKPSKQLIMNLGVD